MISYIGTYLPQYDGLFTSVRRRRNYLRDLGIASLIVFLGTDISRYVYVFSYARCVFVRQKFHFTTFSFAKTSYLELPLRPSAKIKEYRKLATHLLYERDAGKFKLRAALKGQEQAHQKTALRFTEEEYRLILSLENSRYFQTRTNLLPDFAARRAVGSDA